MRDVYRISASGKGTRDRIGFSLGRGHRVDPKVWQKNKKNDDGGGVRELQPKKQAVDRMAFETPQGFVDRSLRRWGERHRDQGGPRTSAEISVNFPISDFAVGMVRRRYEDAGVRPGLSDQGAQGL